MRRAKSAYSPQAKKVEALAHDLQISLFNGDPAWSLVEAATVVTPVGECHLHWKNHRGRGSWTIVTNPKWRGEICGTVRCRRVTIIPHGGENEAVPIKAVESVEKIMGGWIDGVRYDLPADIRW